MASAPIGEIPVLITGDWSDLQSSLDDAVKAAETGAEDIAAAFNVPGDTGISDSVDQATSALETFGSTVESVEPALATLAEGISNIGDTAAGSVAGLHDVSDGLNEVGESGHEAEGGIAGVVEQLIQLGEALVITEAMKEFAGEALEVYGNVQQASISLTALTGSAELADEMIEKLKTVATSDALSFEPLVGAAQKMTALGFSTEQTYKALQAAADTAAATGASFDRVTQAIERMALSGTAGARQLATLGISANMLGNIMGVTADQVTTAFKALDQSQRLDVLEQALSKFGGVAGQVAQGILGQWQNFKTQFEFVMESVGAALAPVAADFLAFVTSDILPFIKSMVDAFNQLPGPVKDFAVVIGLAAAAIPVLNVGLGALLKLLETFEVLNLAEWGTALVASAGNVVYAIQNGLVGALTTGETLLLRLGQAAGVAAAAFAGWELGTWLYNNIPAMKAFGDAMAGWIQQIPGVQALINQFSGLTGATDSLSKATVDLRNKLAGAGVPLFQAAGESADDFSQRLRGVASALGDARNAVAQITPEMLALANAEGAAAQGFANQQKALTDAKTTLQAVTLAYKDGSASLGQYQAAQLAVETAQAAINPNFVTSKMATTELATATKDLSASQVTLASLLKTDTTAGLESVTAAQQNLKSAQSSYESSLATLQQAQITLNSAVAMGTAGYKLQGPAIDALKVAETNAKAAKDDLTSAQKSLTQAQTSATAASKEQATTDSDYATMLNTLGKAALQGYATDQAAVTAAAGKYHDAVTTEMDIQAQLDELVQEGKQGSDDYKTAQLALTAAHQQVTSDLKALNATSTDYNTTSKALLSAQKDIVSSQQQLDTIYLQTSIPNVKNLTGQLQDLRDAKTQVAADTQVQQQAESALQDTLTNYLEGTASLADVTQAQQDLDKAKVQTTGDNKVLKQTETDLQTAFGLTKQAMQDIQNPETTMTQNTQNANAAFSALGIQSATSLQTLADKATTAFNTITTSGTSSPHQIQQAQIAMLQAVQAAYISEGTNLSATQQATLTDLLNKQTDFNNSMINQWHNLYVTIEGDVSSLSDTLITDLFTGKHSFGQDAIAELEKIASAFVSTLIKPITDAIGQFIAGALSNLLKGITSIGTSMSSVASSSGFSSLLGLFNSAGPGVSQSPAFGDTISTGATGLATTGEGLADAGSSVASAAGTVATSITGAISAIGGVVGAITGIIGDIETGRSNDILYSIEQNTTATAILMGQQVQLMWRLAADLEFGVMEKGILALSTTGLKAIQDQGSAFAYYSKYALGNLGQINSNTGSMLMALQKGINIGSGGAGSYAAGTLENPANAPGQDAVTAAQEAAAQASQSSAVAAQVLQNVTDLVQSDQNKYGTLASSYTALQQTLDTAAQVLASREATLAADVGSNASEQQIDIDQQKVLLAAQAVQQAQLKLAQDQQGAAAAQQLAADQQRLTQAQNAATAAQSGSSAAATLAAQEAAEESYVSAEQAYQDIGKISDSIQWFQTAMQNINNGIVACAGWLQGISGILQTGISVAGSTTSASSAGLSALATYIGANFTSLETWLFTALGKTMALPALPGAIAIPAGLGGAAATTSGGLTINMTNTVNGSVVGQNGLNQFANGIGNLLIGRLRNAGMKY